MDAVTGTILPSPEMLGGVAMDDLISRQAALRELHLLAIEALRKQRRDYCAIIDICSNKKFASGSAGIENSHFLR